MPFSISYKNSQSPPISPAPAIFQFLSPFLTTKTQYSMPQTLINNTCDHKYFSPQLLNHPHLYTYLATSQGDTYLPRATLAGRRRLILGCLHVVADNFSDRCVAKETSLAIQKMPRNATKTRIMGTWYKFGVCMTGITYAACAIISLYFSLTNLSLRFMSFGSTYEEA